VAELGVHRAKAWDRIGMRLYDHWRSSSAYRVRIALRLKGLDFEAVAVDLRQGAHRTLDYLGHNHQGLVPSLEVDSLQLTQSLAIIEWLDEMHPAPPLLPADPASRALVRSLALHVACELQPPTNLRVLQCLKNRLGLDQQEVNAWYRHWIAEGLGSLESRLAIVAGRHCVGDEVTLADLCLVPQLYSARRHECELGPYPTLRWIEAACLRLAAFVEARPEHQAHAA
jgi:maleylacetoacetate isomerase